jgi:hypothetical protein
MDLTPQIDASSASTPYWHYIGISPCALLSVVWPLGQFQATFVERKVGMCESRKGNEHNNDHVPPTYCRVTFASAFLHFPIGLLYAPSLPFIAIAMPALSLVRGWSIAILPSFFCLSLAQSLVAFAVVPDSSSAVYTETSLQAAYSSPWPLNNRSSETLTSTASQIVSLSPTGFFTASSDASSVAASSSLGQYPTSSVTPSAAATSASYSSSVPNSAASAPSTPTNQIGASLSSLRASASSTLISQSAGLSSASASPTSTTASNNATSTIFPLPTSVNGFSLVGCVASTDGYQGFELRENSTAMSLGRCVSDCVEFAYAGTFDR